jgi:hypothetical protein
VEKSVVESGNQGAKEVKTLTARLEKEGKASADKIEALHQEVTGLKDKYEKEGLVRQQSSVALETERSEKRKLNEAVCRVLF